MAKIKVDILYKKDLAKTPLIGEIILPSDWSVLQSAGGVSIYGDDIKDDTITKANLIKTEELLTGSAQIANAIITNAKIDTLNANKIVAGSGIIAALAILNTLTIGNADNDGKIQSHGWDGSADGFKILGGATPEITLIGGTITGGTIQTADSKVVMSGEQISVGASNPILIDGANKRIRSNNYVSGYAGAGFSLDEDLFEVGNIACRGLIRTSVFQKDVISAMGGNFIILGADVLDADMDATDAETLTTKATTTFSVGDFLRIKDGTDDEWLEVTAVNGAVYTVTRDKKGDYAANANPAWKKGATVVNYGQSGAGGIFMTASESNAPYLSVFTHAGSPWTDLTTKLRIGNLNGFNGFSSDVYGISIGSVSAGKYLNYDDVSGDLIVNDTKLLFNDIFGDGSDGNVTISSNTTLTSDMYYNNLTVNAGITLNTGGYRIFVKGILTIAGKIARDGINGGNGGNGDNAAGHTAGAGGSGGTAGTALATGSISGGKDGKAGTAGGNGGTTNKGASATGPTVGDDAVKGFSSNGVAGSAGGAGGASDYTSTAGITGATAGSLSGTVFNKPRNAINAMLLRDDFPSTDVIRSSAGTGGGAGGSGGSGAGGAGGGSGGGGGGAGGGGGTGGIVLIFAKVISITGSISADGGDGGTGGNGGAGGAGTNDRGGGGGGGGAGGSGGSGGLLVVVYNKKSGAGTITSSAGSLSNAGTGGAGGAGSALEGQPGSSGVNGLVGIAGKIIELEI